MFRKLDVDGDGTVNSLEFKRGLRKLRIGDYLSEKDVRRCECAAESTKSFACLPRGYDTAATLSNKVYVTILTPPTPYPTRPLVLFLLSTRAARVLSDNPLTVRTTTTVPLTALDSNAHGTTSSHA